MKKILLLWVVALSHAHAASEYSGAVSHGDWMRMILGLMVVVALILLLAFAVRKLQGVGLGSSTGMKVLAQMSLGPKERVILVSVGGRYLLLGAGNASVSMLYDFGIQMPQGFEANQSTGFVDILKSIKGAS